MCGDRNCNDSDHYTLYTCIILPYNTLQTCMTKIIINTSWSCISEGSWVGVGFLALPWDGRSLLGIRGRLEAQVGFLLPASTLLLWAECVHVPQVHMLKPNHPGDGIRRRDLWEGIAVLSWLGVVPCKRDLRDNCLPLPPREHKEQAPSVNHPVDPLHTLNLPCLDLGLPVHSYHEKRRPLSLWCFIATSPNRPRGHE